MYRIEYLLVIVTMFKFVDGLHINVGTFFKKIRRFYFQRYGVQKMFYKNLRLSGWRFPTPTLENQMPICANNFLATKSSILKKSLRWTKITIHQRWALTLLSTIMK
jgi:hypothetical protein